FLVYYCAAIASGPRSFGSIAFHVRLERLFQGVGPGTKRFREADNNRNRIAARSVVGVLATHFGWFHRCRPSARGHVLPLAASIYRRSHARSGEVAWCGRIGAGHRGRNFLITQMTISRAAKRLASLAEAELSPTIDESLL